MFKHREVRTAERSILLWADTCWLCLSATKRNVFFPFVGKQIDLCREILLYHLFLWVYNFNFLWIILAVKTVLRTNTSQISDGVQRFTSYKTDHFLLRAARKWRLYFYCLQFILIYQLNSYWLLTEYLCLDFWKKLEETPAGSGEVKVRL